MSATQPRHDARLGDLRGRRPGEHAYRPDCVACIDIKNYFPSVSHRHVYAFLVRKGCSFEVARLMTRLLTWRGGLPQGSPASPTLANLLLEDLDASLVRFGAQGLVTTRFVDDITVSGPAEAVRKAVEVVIRHLHRYGLKINREKLKIQHSGGRQQVTNLNVNRSLGLPKTSPGGRVLSSKSLRDTVRRAKAYGLSPKEEKRLRGRLNYLSQLSAPRAKALLSELDGVATP